MASLADLLRGGTDVLGYLRYGVPTSEKERLALSQALPYAPSAASEDPVEAERFASGYLFAREHPALAELVQPAVDRVRLAWFGDTPELQSWARAGANAARIAPELSLAGLLGDSLMRREKK